MAGRIVAKAAAESCSPSTWKGSPRQVHTEVTKAGTFYKAEDYHQDYYEKNPVRYKFYRYNCGRDQRIEEL